MLTTLPTAFAATATAAPGAAAGYLGVLTVASLRSPRRLDAPAFRRRFSVMIPAHDEEAVIARTLDSMSALDYPVDLFEIHVVADNCTDRTADIVRAAGFTVHERSNTESPGKGAALNWLIERIEADTQLDRQLYERAVELSA